jgi:alpha-tubulin suppressor-like RCC1 family protein
MTKIPWLANKGIKIKDISAGGRHSLAISEEFDENNNLIQALYAWGFGFYY